MTEQDQATENGAAHAKGMTDEHGVAHATFTIERHYDHSPEQVFAAWADPAVKRRWFAGGGTDYALDFRVGGVEHNGGSHEGVEIRWESLYREIAPGRRIVYTSTLSMGDTLATVSQATVELVADGGGTRLTLTEQGAYLDGHERPEWREDGTGQQLDALGTDLDASGDSGA